jgi:imidazolonepropionase-like amidohydrolase
MAEVLMRRLKQISSYLPVVACLLFAATWSVQTQTPARNGITVFEGARLITGDGGAAIEDSAFTVQNNLFTAVGRRGALQVPAGAARVDLTGKTVMPAKVDLHGHLGFEDVVAGTTSKENFTRQNLVEQLERYAYMGFSAVVSMADLAEREIFPGDHLDVYQGPRNPLLPKTGRMPWGNVPRQVATEVIPNAALFRTAGPGIAMPGGGAGGHESRNDIMYPITTPEEARRAVQDYVKTKPEWVKIWVDAREGNLKMGTLTPPLYIAVIQEARRLGFDTVAHTVTLADAKQLYKAGLVGAAHIPVRGGEHPDEEFLAIIRDRVARNTGSVPLWFNEHGTSTALGPEAWDDPLLWEMLERDQVMDQQGEAIKRMTPAAVARARQSSKETGDDAKKLIGAGMKLVYGSDNGAAGRGFGWYEQLRFENWIPMGFTPSEAIVMATRDGAQVAKINTGMVAKGRSADFIVLDGNPLENIANTRRINKVYLRGAEVDRAGIRAKWQAKWGKWKTSKQRLEVRG